MAGTIRLYSHRDSLIIFPNACHNSHAYISCRFRFPTILHVFSRLRFMLILFSHDSACIFAPVSHADFDFPRFCMYFRACVSCRFCFSAIPHVFSRLRLMQILFFRDSTCIFAPAFHADSGFPRFCMYFRACVSCRFCFSAIPHVFSRLRFMLILISRDSACIFAPASHADFVFPRFCMYSHACVSC